MISDVSELNIVCVLDENNDMKELYMKMLLRKLSPVSAVSGAGPVTAGKPDRSDPKNSRVCSSKANASLRSGI
ncbi:MAG: hypothetical protein ACLR7D_00260 [Lachnospira eligens]